jgi:methionine biosynthesis protein MetW
MIPEQTHSIIEQWIEPESRVLDLGCGDGSLLSRLVRDRRVEGIGVEISQDMIVKCLANGISVYQADIDRGLSQWDDLSFDFVILNATLQVIHRPHGLINEMLRVGRSAIISVSNFGFVRNRIRVFCDGRISREARISGSWHNTPVIRFVSLEEFLHSLHEMDIDIVDARYFLPWGGIMKTRAVLDNLLVKGAVFMLKRET